MSTYSWCKCADCGRETYQHERYIRRINGIYFCEYCRSQRSAKISKPELTPQELRKKADEHYESVLRADRTSDYHRGMDEVKALRDEADRLEAELHS